MVTEPRHVHPIQRLLTVLCGIAFAVALILTIAQTVLILWGEEIRPFIRVNATAQNSDVPNKRGTFVRQQGTFYEVLGFTIPAPELLQKCVRVPRAEMNGVFVHRAAVENQESFLLFRFTPEQLATAFQADARGDGRAWTRLNEQAQEVPVRVERVGTSTVVGMQLANSAWLPGGYMLRLPAEGVSVGTYWYYFVVE